MLIFVPRTKGQLREPSIDFTGVWVNKLSDVKCSLQILVCRMRLKYHDLFSSSRSKQRGNSENLKAMEMKQLFSVSEAVAQSLPVQQNCGILAFFFNGNTTNTNAPVLGR